MLSCEACSDFFISQALSVACDKNEQAPTKMLLRNSLVLFSDSYFSNSLLSCDF